MTNEVELLRRATKGDEAAFCALYRSLQGPVFRFALHMSGQVETAEEVVQEVFLSLLTAGNGFSPASGSLQGYLLGAARNMIRNRLRHERRFVELEPAVHREEMVESVSRDEELRELRAAILSLPANHRAVVVLCDLEGMDYAQAAQCLACPIGTVRSRLHRARAILGAKMRRQVGCAT